MRTADVCPTCATYINALCVIFDGPQLTTLDINPLDDLDTALNKIETWAASIDSIANISDDPYGPGWDGDTGVATKNAIYDKIEDVIANIPEYTLTAVISDAFSLQKDGITVSTIDLSPYLDDRARLNSGAVDGGGTLTLTRDDATNFTVDLSSLVNPTPITATDQIANTGADNTSTYVEHDELATVATTGNYSDLSGAPTTTSVFTNNGSDGTSVYVELDELSTVATTGNYSDLSGAPTTTSAFTNNGSDGTSTYVEADEISTVATSGDYNDLSNLPTLFTSPLTTKGDLFTYDTGDQRLAVGTDGQMLYADSTQATGLRWDDAPDTYQGELAAPVEFRYQNSAAMIADQGNQTANYFEYVRDTDTYYEYLGTINGNITDYAEITDPSVINILRGKALPAVHIVYANQAAMLADQNKQVTGSLYRTSDDDQHYEFAGTATGAIGDYVPFGSGGTTSPLTTKGDIYTFDTDNQRLPVGTNGQVLSANSAQATGLEWLTLATVATTGAYSDLSGVPTLSTVATSGDYNDLSNLPTIPNAPSGLEVLTEANGSTWRIIGKPAANYGEGGLYAIDLSHSSQATNANGALGNYSFAAGLNNIAAGDYDVVMGTTCSTNAAAGYNFLLSDTSVSGANSYNGFIAGGYQIDIDGYGNFATGYYHVLRPNGTLTAGHTVGGIRNKPTGYYMSMFGAGLIGTGAYTTVLGVGNVDFSENTGGSTVVQRKLFVIGNGTVDGLANRLTASDAFNVYNEGQVIADSMTTTHIDGWGTGKILVTREWIEAQSFSTGTYSPPLTTKGDLFTYDTDDARLAVGTNGQILSANSSTATGLEWIDAPSTATLASIGDVPAYPTGGAITYVLRYDDNTDSFAWYDDSAYGGSTPNLQAVTDVGSVTTNNIDALSFNELELFLQSGVNVNNIGIGTDALASNTGLGIIAIGTRAGENNTQSGITAIGYEAAQNNTGLQLTAVGYQAAQNAGGFTITALGYGAALNASGFYLTALGASAGDNQDGDYVEAIGYYAARNNAGNNVVSIGSESLRYNSGHRNVAVGYAAGRVAVGDDNIYIGYQASNYTQLDTGNAQNVADATNDVDTGLNRITITGHGFTEKNGRLWLNYTTTGTPIGGLISGNLYEFNVVDGNTLESVRNLTATGSDTHTFTPFVDFDNTIVIGSGAESTKSNQVTLGDSNITELVSGNYKFNVGQALTATEDNYVLTYDDGTGTIRFEAAAGGVSVLSDVGDVPAYPTGGTETYVLRYDDNTDNLSWVDETTLGGGSDSVAYREVPTGLVNGVNTDFVIVNTAISIDFIWVYINGVFRSDFTWNAPTKTITMGFAPETGSVIEVQYISSLADPFPDITNHNSLSGLNVGDFQHLTAVEYANAGTAYTHSQSAHAPADAQKNSDITKGEIEAKLTGEISSHTHDLIDQTGIAQLAPELKATAAATGGTANENINWSDGIQFPVPMTQDTTLTFSNIVQGKSIMLVVTGNHTLTMPTGVDSADWQPDFVGTNTNYIQLYCVDSATPTFLTTIISKA